MADRSSARRPRPLPGVRRPRRVLAPLIAALAVLAFVAGIVTVAVVAGAPSSDAPAGSPDPRLRGTWQLASGVDPLGRFNLGSRTFSLTVGDAKHTGGSSGCGLYDARVIGQPGAVFVTVTSQQNPPCLSDGDHALEERYFGALSEASVASLHAGELELRGGSTVLTFVPLQTARLSSVTGRTWLADGKLVETSRGQQFGVVLPETTFYLALGRMTGTVGCARFHGTYTANGSLVITSNVIADVASCPPRQNLTTISRVFRAITGRFTASVDESGALTIDNRDEGMSMDLYPLQVSQ